MKISLTSKSGFTLVELLICLAILGEIATFTIPKIITAQQMGTYNASAKEIAASISAAYQQYQLNNALSSSTKFADMTQYLNYIKVDNSSTIDDKQKLDSLSCNMGASGGCLVFHSGGYLRYNSSTFAGTASTNAIELFFDPNGRYSGTTNSPDKSVQFFVYYNGRITTQGTATPSTVAAGYTYPATPDPTYDPPWFSW